MLANDVIDDMAFIALAALAAGLAFLFARERRARRAVEAAFGEDRRARAEMLSHLAGALAHEVRNPLNTLSLTIQFLERLLGRDPGKADTRAAMEKHLGTGAGELEKIKRALESFVELARPRELALEDVDLAAVVAHAVEAERARRNGAVGGIELAIDAGPTPARVDAKEIETAVEAVVANALEALSGAGARTEEPSASATRTSTKRVEVVCRSSESGAEIIVRDTGTGFTESALGRAFEPYFSTKADHAGLGLARTRLIVEAHGGRIGAANRRPEGGAEVRIELPAGGGARASARAARTQHPQQGTRA